MKSIFLVLALASTSASCLAQAPLDLLNTAITKMRDRGNYTWTISSLRGGGDSTANFFAYPAVTGRKAGENFAVSVRTPTGEIELLRQNEKTAVRSRMQWKTPDEIKTKAAADITGDANAAQDAILIPIDFEGFLLGEDPTAVGGDENPYKPVPSAPIPTPQPNYGQRRQNAGPIVQRPLAGATLVGGTNAPTPPLADPATLATALLETIPDPMTKAAELAEVLTDVKTVGAGIFEGKIPTSYLEKISGLRKKYGDDQPPQISESTVKVRFWTSENGLYKYQIAVNASLILGPAYNPLPVFVNRTTTVELRAIGVTRIDIPPAAAKLLK